MRLLPQLQTLLILTCALLVAQYAMTASEEEWITDEWFELTGRIVELERGSPHSEIVLQAKDRRWTVEIGAPWRNQRAGLAQKTLAAGRTVTAYGHRSTNPDEMRMKAVRLTIDGRNYDLYPNRIR